MGLFQVDAQGEIVYTNDRLHEILGIERVTSFEAQMASVVEDDRESLKGALVDLLGEGRPVDVEVELRLHRATRCGSAASASERSHVTMAPSAERSLCGRRYRQRAHAR